MAAYSGELRLARAGDDSWKSGSIRIEGGCLYIRVNGHLAAVPPLESVRLDETDDGAALLTYSYTSWLFRSDGLESFKEELASAQSDLAPKTSPGRSAGQSASSSVTVVGYLAFSLALILGTGLITYEAGLRDTAFGVAMTIAWGIVLLGAVFRPTRVFFDRVGLGLLIGVLVIGVIAAQVFAIGWIVLELVNGRLELGLLWILGLIAWLYFLWRQIKWLIEEGYYSIRRRMRRAKD